MPPLRRSQRMQTFCSNVYTDRWVYHFVNVYQGCYKERFRSFSSLFLFNRIVQLLAAVFVSTTEDALHIHLILTLVLLLIAIFKSPYHSRHSHPGEYGPHSCPESKDNTYWHYQWGKAVLHISSVDSDLLTPPIPGVFFGKKVYRKYAQWRCCQKREAPTAKDLVPWSI